MMTFSIAARCAQTGMLGVAVTSSSICVASRCAFVAPGVGAALSQNITDPRLGRQLLTLLEEGLSPAAAIGHIVSENPLIGYRQLGVIAASGETAFFHGEKTLGIYAAARGRDCVAMGNLLASERVPQALIDSFETSSGPLGRRLLSALQSGSKAGGEAGPVYSAGLLIADDRVPWPSVDLRVDWSDTADPVTELEQLWQRYEPQSDDYLNRALDPRSAPAYGVPGDP